VYSFQEPSLQETTLFGTAFTTTTMPGTLTLGKTSGTPALPVTFRKLLLPPKTTVTSVQVNGAPLHLESEADLCEKPVIPYQDQVPVGFPLPDTIALDTTIYASSDPYPRDIVESLSLGYCRGYPILTLALHPVQYLPSKGILQYYSELEVTVLLEEDSSVNDFYRNLDIDKQWIRHIVDNPEVADLYTAALPTRSYPGGLCDPTDHYDYVIITTTQNDLDYWETTGAIPYNWVSLMDKHESDDGFACTLVTIEDIDICPDYWSSDPLFNDLEAHIREFCKDAYEDWETEYILIGGDDEWIPAREMDYEYESNVDADIYWNHLDNTFNDDHDYDWGEEGDTGFDLFAEMFIGRLPCDDSQDVSNWMTKSFYYADAVDMDYLENAAFYGGETTWNCQGDDFIDYSAIKGTNNWLGPIPGAHGPYPAWLGFQFGFETWNALNPGVEYDLSEKWTGEPPNPGWQGGSTSAAINGLKNAINNDRVTLISGIAHADSGKSLDVDDDDWESQYHNTKPFFLHDYGCHCGDIDAPDGVLHSMLFHSDTELAFACVYHTSFGWGSFDDTNSSSALQQKLFWDYLFDVENNSESPENWQLGKAMTWARDSMAPTIDWTYYSAPGSWRGTIEACLLFGDPAQRLKSPLYDTEPPVTTLSYDGDSGENGWYVTPGNVILTSVDYESAVMTTYYRVNGGDWTIYEMPFSLTQNGMNVVSFYSVDLAGNQEQVNSEFVKLDFIKPEVMLTKQQLSEEQIKFKARVTDDESGAGYVEFYLDDELQETDTSSPFEWIWEGTGRHTVQAYAYDTAGNMEKSNTLSTPTSHSFEVMVRQFLQPLQRMC
jgi:hypothetical protein